MKVKRYMIISFLLVTMLIPYDCQCRYKRGTSGTN
jgi:hypothetical protein